MRGINGNNMTIKDLKEMIEDQSDDSKVEVITLATDPNKGILLIGQQSREIFLRWKNNVTNYVPKYLDSITDYD